MRRRVFLRSGSAAFVATLTAACGGGGGGTDAGAASATDANLAAGTAPALATASTTSRNAVAGEVSYPFGARLDGYAAGVLPSHVPAAQRDVAVKACYDRWKAAAVVDVPTVPGGKAVRFSRDHLAVSESMGYGMLITVLMAGHDPQAREQFDALLKTVRARPAYSISRGQGGPYLMDWRLARDGASTNEAGGGWNAFDGDLDIAMALLMADRQWGSSGAWNYKQEGVNTIDAMAKHNMRGDGTTMGLPQGHVSRTSDYMTGHFRAFKRATGDKLWDRAVDRSVALLERMQSVYSPNAGLMPDFVIRSDTADPSPSPGGYGDFTDTEGFYYANAQRNPWRLGTDVLTTGDTRVKAVCQRLLDFIERDCGGNPAAIGVGYRLDGTAMGRQYAPTGVIGPMVCGAMVDASYQAFVNRLWDWNANNFTTNYYDSELQLIPMIVASGNWWNP